MSDKKKVGDVVGFVVWDDQSRSIKYGPASRREIITELKDFRCYPACKGYRIAKLVLGK